MPRFFKRLFKFPQMDFEMAVWEMTSLIVAPKKVFRSIYYHVETKNTWHRPDPSFTYLLSFFLLLTSIAWGLAYADGFGKIAKVAAIFVFVHFLAVSLLVSTAAYFLVGRLLGPGVPGLPGRRRQGLFMQPGEAEQLEFGYCFDVSIRAFFPVWVFLYVIQFLLMPVISKDYWVSLFFGNSLYLLAFGYYTVITFLGYNALPFLHHTELLLAPTAVFVILWFASLFGLNLPKYLAPITSSTHDICIFCASRLGLTPAAPPPVYIQRRHLNSSPKASQSSAQAALRQDDSQDDMPARGRCAGTEQMGATLGGGRMRDEASRTNRWGVNGGSGLSASEEREREVLRARAAAAAAQQDGRAERGRWRADQDTRYTTISIRPATTKKTAATPSPNVVPSKPQSLEHSRTPRSPFDANLTANWKHLKRRGQNNGDQASAQSANPPRPPPQATPMFRRVELQATPEGYVSLNGTPARPPPPSKEAPPRRVEEVRTVPSQPPSEARVEPPREERHERQARQEREEHRPIPRRFLDDRGGRSMDPGPRRRNGHDRNEAARRDRYARDADLDDEPRERISKAERKKQKKAEKAAAAETAAPTPIYLPEFISVTNLASALRVRLEDFVAKMEALGFENVEGSHILTAENAGLIAMEYNFDPIADTADEDIDLRAAPEPSPEERIVTIMGHVDHGKTTILDYLRKSSIAATEHGGITQHIGAFSVPLAASNKTITFLDTPGHAAFLSMRQRGATVTDIVILVVAADDSVKPQTIEAIRHAKAAQVPLIVAINKCDKDEAKPEIVKADLARQGVEVEDFGGDVQCICVSGKTGLGMRELEEAAVTLSEILDHRADTEGPTEGWVLEATTKTRGRVATVLVRRGTLRPGDVLVAGATWARVKTLRNEAGALVEEVGPGMPVEVDGWKGQPVAGDEVLQAPDEQRATAVVQLRGEKKEREAMAKDMEAINEARRLEAEKREREEAAARAAENGEALPEDATAESKQVGLQEVFFVLKADVSGSVEAVLNAVSALGNAEVAPHILRSGVGPVSQFDIEHAAAAKGHIISFNMAVEPKMAQMAESQGVKILDQSIIYRLVDDVRAVLSERLPPLITQRVTGEAEVAMGFDINLGGRKTMKIAGVKVRNGVVGRGNRVRVMRGKETIYDGTITSLKSSKKDVSEMRKGTECGMGFDAWEGFEAGDEIQCYEERTEKRML
ncbi:translation initiation factor IF-2 [Coniosporium tulheliwenetii]|uniref:Translation initiation factor IF-2 n=1 Tax=Coniosporium tulheliwenetii TaxID=3383036 RepID=A0ACC2ZIC7_9PEZI|nr:translation initiation factor IF-2 [Cladosporium sp. JES 115]